MCDALTGEQISQFDELIDNDKVMVDHVLKQGGDYQSEDRYRALAKELDLNVDSPELNNEYARIFFLDSNYPEYRQIVADTLEELRRSVRRNKEQFLNMDWSAIDERAKKK